MTTNRYREYRMLIEDVIGPTAWLLEPEEIAELKELVAHAMDRCLELMADKMPDDELSTDN